VHGRRRISAGSCNYLTEVDSFTNAEGPDLTAEFALCFDRKATVEQFHDIGERKPMLQLLALAPRACSQEDHRWAHGRKSTPGASAAMSEKY
jgi:hypothetical protein